MHIEYVDYFLKYVATLQENDTLYRSYTYEYDNNFFMHIYNTLLIIMMPIRENENE